MDQGELDSLRTWLETSGQALELRVARAFRAAGLEVVDPFYYEDVNSRTAREGDVAVWVPSVVDEPPMLLTIECKHTDKREQQWVGVRPTANKPRPLKLGWQWVSWSGDVLDRSFDDRAIEAVVRSGLAAPTPPCSRILTAHARESHNPAWNACRQALSAAFGLGRSEFMKSNAYGSVVTGAVVAAVITTARLRTCQLTAAGHLDIQETDHFEVLCESPTGQLRPVLVLNESHLPELVQTVSGRA